MNYVDALQDTLKDGANNFWKSVKTMPADKFEWRPEPTTRTARELAEEIVMTTGYVSKLVRAHKDPGMEDSTGDTIPKTIEVLEQEHRAKIDEFIAAVRDFPNEELKNTIELPWGTWTFSQVIAYPYWNLMYHWGQVNYIQTLYGDKNM